MPYLLEAKPDGQKEALARATSAAVSEGHFQPKEWLRFIQEDLFEKCWAAIGLNDDDLRALEMAVMVNPDGPPIMEGTGGIRKIRFTSHRWGRGKSGGARVYYLYVPSKCIVVWMFVHLKGEKESLTKADKNEIRSLVKEVLALLEQGRYDNT